MDYCLRKPEDGDVANWIPHLDSKLDGHDRTILWRMSDLNLTMNCESLGDYF